MLAAVQDGHGWMQAMENVVITTRDAMNNRYYLNAAFKRLQDQVDLMPANVRKHRTLFTMQRVVCAAANLRLYLSSYGSYGFTSIRDNCKAGSANDIFDPTYKSHHKQLAFETVIDRYMMTTNKVQASQDQKVVVRNIKDLFMNDPILMDQDGILSEAKVLCMIAVRYPDDILFAFFQLSSFRDPGCSISMSAHAYAVETNNALLRKFGFSI